MLCKGMASLECVSPGKKHLKASQGAFKTCVNVWSEIFISSAPLLPVHSKWGADKWCSLCWLHPLRTPACFGVRRSSCKSSTQQRGGHDFELAAGPLKGLRVQVLDHCPLSGLTVYRYMCLHGETDENMRRSSNFVCESVAIWWFIHQLHPSCPRQPTWSLQSLLGFQTNPGCWLHFLSSTMLSAEEKQLLAFSFSMPLQCLTLLLQWHLSLREHWTLLHREKEVLDVFLLGKHKEKLERSVCGGRGWDRRAWGRSHRQSRLAVPQHGTLQSMHFLVASLK